MSAFQVFLLLESKTLLLQKLIATTYSTNQCIDELIISTSNTQSNDTRINTCRQVVVRKRFKLNYKC